MDFLFSLNQTAILADFKDFAILIPRIIFGVTFFYYGQFKIRDLKQNAKDFEEIHGFYPGWLWGSLVALLETFGSVLILLGVFLVVVPLGFIVHMTLGTLWKVTKTDKPFTDWSYDLLLLSIAVLFLIAGPGRITLLALFGG